MFSIACTFKGGLKSSLGPSWGYQSQKANGRSFCGILFQKKKIRPEKTVLCFRMKNGWKPLPQNRISWFILGGLCKIFRWAPMSILFGSRPRLLGYLCYYDMQRTRTFTLLFSCYYLPAKGVLYGPLRQRQKKK